MEWLNYHHLLYFYVVAKEGTIARASEQLSLAQPTISAQLHMLEDSLGEKLFQRAGRNLVLTDFGRVVFQYAEDIFGVGRELLDFVRGRPSGRPLRFTVGISDSLPKTLVHKLLTPAFLIPEPIHMICEENHSEDLLLALSTHKFDVVLTDSPHTPRGIKAFVHPLGSCGFSFYAVPELARTLKKDFPRSLHGAPFLLPLENSGLRRALDQWFTAQEIRPRIVAEFQDTALAKAFGQAGVGVFPAPTAVDQEIRKSYGVLKIGSVETVETKFYAVSVERRFKHPAVLAILRAAREEIFSPHPPENSRKQKLH